MNLAARMKGYEAAQTSARLMPRLPIVARVDGRAFHTLCKGMEKPFDQAMHDAMVATASALVSELNGALAHTASDEISLLLLPGGPESEPLFGGKPFKLNSVIASIATAHFNDGHLKLRRLATFDCRTFQLPTRQEVVNYFVWREQDAARNSVAGLAQSYFSHKQLHQKNGGQMQEMLWQEHGVNWNDLPAVQKRGAYLRRIVEDRTLTQEEWEAIPEPYRPPRDQVFTRGRIAVMDWPRLTAMTDAVATIFGDEKGD